MRAIARRQEQTHREVGTQSHGTHAVGRAAEKGDLYMRNITKLAGVLAVGGLVAVGGSAFTAGGSLPAASGVQSYASQSISGVTASSITYNTDSTGATYTSVGLVLDGDTTAKTIQIAFNDAAPATCSGTGTYDGTATTTSYTCTVNQDVNAASKFALVAS
jgi:hypothetical protein